VPEPKARPVSSRARRRRVPAKRWRHGGDRLPPGRIIRTGGGRQRGGSRRAGEVQHALDGYVASYNALRPHQALGMAVPIERFSLVGPQAARSSAHLKKARSSTRPAQRSHPQGRHQRQGPLRRRQVLRGQRPRARLGHHQPRRGQGPATTGANCCAPTSGATARRRSR
jgi:hypothetical protein